jgi:hypothetical protein
MLAYVRSGVALYVRRAPNWKRKGGLGFGVGGNWGLPAAPAHPKETATPQSWEVVVRKVAKNKMRPDWMARMDYTIPSQNVCLCP